VTELTNAEPIVFDACAAKHLAARFRANRRTVARAWTVEHAAWEREQQDRNLLENGLDLLGGDDEPKPPNLAPTEPPRIPLPAPPQAPRK